MVAEITSLASYLVYFNVWRENLGVFHEIGRVAGARKWWAQEGTGAREGDTRGEAAHYFQAPATQAIHESSREL